MPKNIVVCSDGTGNEYGKNNTNVVKLYERIIRDAHQITFYDPGVGTLGRGRSPVCRWLNRTLKQATGIGMRQNVEDAYVYLMNQFEPGDRIFLFGFSRGAYTVRSLAGMLHKVGLFQAGNMNLVPYAWKMYDKDERLCQEFKETCSRICKPHFIGVWDTVGSVFGKRKRFLDPTLNADVTYGLHAVAIDEKRKKFPVSLWNEAKEVDDQTIEQVWFAGVHSDVGGSYPESGLSDIALEWMLVNAEKHGLRLRQCRKGTLKPDPLGTLHESRRGHWRLFRPVDRPIPKNAKIHASVFHRIDNDVSYQPKNLPCAYEKVTTEQPDPCAD